MHDFLASSFMWVRVSFVFLVSLSVYISLDIVFVFPATTTAAGHRGLGGRRWWCALYDVLGSFWLLNVISISLLAKSLVI